MPTDTLPVDACSLAVGCLALLLKIKKEHAEIGRVSVRQRVNSPHMRKAFAIDLGSPPR